MTSSWTLLSFSLLFYFVTVVELGVIQTENDDRTWVMDHEHIEGYSDDDDDDHSKKEGKQADIQTQEEGMGPQYDEGELLKQVLTQVKDMENGLEHYIEEWKDESIEGWKDENIEDEEEEEEDEEDWKDEKNDDTQQYEILPNIKRCWRNCKKMGKKMGKKVTSESSALCEKVCGTGGYCCRKGYGGCPKEMAEFNPSKRHMCIKKKTDKPKVKPAPKKVKPAPKKVNPAPKVVKPGAPITSGCYDYDKLDNTMVIDQLDKYIEQKKYTLLKAAKFCLFGSDYTIWSIVKTKEGKLQICKNKFEKYTWGGKERVMSGGCSCACVKNKAGIVTGTDEERTAAGEVQAEEAAKALAKAQAGGAEGAEGAGAKLEGESDKEVEECDRSVNRDLLGVPASDTLEEGCLNAANYFRKRHLDTPPLEWDDNLAAEAQRWAEEMGRRTPEADGTWNWFLGHDPVNSENGWGENIAVGTSWNPAGLKKTSECQRANKRWYDEIFHWNFATKSRKGTGVTGHFTQVVWKGTQKVGFGVHFEERNGRHYLYTVAKYSPPGNYMGEYVNNVMPRSAEYDGECVENN